MNKLRYSLALLVVSAVVIPGIFVSSAEAKIQTLCSNQTIIYAQDIQDYTPTGGNNSAVINNETGNQILVVPQQGNQTVIWPQTTFVPVLAGETLKYKNEDNTGTLIFDILDASGTFIKKITYGKTTIDATVSIDVNGFVRFNQGDIAHEQNYLVLCKPSTVPPSSPPPPSTGNQAPVWNITSSKFTTAGQFISFAVSAIDPNNDALTYTVFNLPSGASFSNQTFNWVPNTSQIGVYSPTFRVSDGTTNVDMTVTISVTSSGGSSSSGNNAPVWNQIPTQTINTNQTLQFSVSAVDADFNSLYYSAPQIPAGATFNTASKTFQWTPYTSQAGSYQVTFRVSDGTTYVDMNVLINVIDNYYYNNNSPSNFNTTPNFTNIPPKTVTVGSTLEFYVTETNQYQNYYGGSSNIQVINLPAGATFNTYDRLFRWTPNANQVGTYTVQFRVYNGNNYTTIYANISVVPQQQTATSAINFVNFNPSPLATEGALYTYRVQATNNNSFPITYRLTSNPSGMTINSSSGVISWIPSFSQGGSTPHQVTVEASDGISRDTRSFYINVLNVNTSSVSAPVAQPPVAPAVQNLEIFNIEIDTNLNGDVMVSWETNIPSTNRVIYDTISQGEKSSNFTYANATIEEANLKTEHNVNLGNLEINKNYYLRAVAKSGTQTEISRELIFVKVPREIASSLGIFGSLPVSTWVIAFIALVLGILLIVAYRRSQTIA